MILDIVSISGDYVVIGVGSDDNNGLFDSGSVYIFVRNGSTWTEQTKLVAPDADHCRFFGWSVSISENSVVVGSLDANLPSGSAYVFIRSGNTWTHQAILTVSDLSLIHI